MHETLGETMKRRGSLWALAVRVLTVDLCRQSVPPPLAVGFLKFVTFMELDGFELQFLL